MLNIGLLINPVAGVGGPAAMKGSDGTEAQTRAGELGVQPQAVARAAETFKELQRILTHSVKESGKESGKETGNCRLITLAGPMGEDALEGSDASGSAIERVVLSHPEIAFPTTSAMTRAGVEAVVGLVDLLVFVGGDGTARDVLDALGENSDVPVLGVPAGVKMHSGVFATSPGSAASLLAELIQGGLVAAHHAEVRDIDEAALRQGVVGSRRYGEMLVPSAGDYLQHVKSGGKEVEALVLLEIAAEVAESLAGESRAGQTPLILGPGSTCFAIKQQLLGESSQAPSTSPSTSFHFSFCFKFCDTARRRRYSSG